jgi:predicted homoserine dehydrogenase-like protein
LERYETQLVSVIIDLELYPEVVITIVLDCNTVHTLVAMMNLRKIIWVGIILKDKHPGDPWCVGKAREGS